MVHQLPRLRSSPPRPAALVGCVLAGLLVAKPVSAVELSEAGRREIGELLGRVEKSGCQFNRSGNWYSGPEARAHLQRKYEYLLARHQIASAEDFVVRAATKSSMSGEAYQMRCGQAAPTLAAAWLDAELRRLRTPPPPPSK